MKKLTAVYIFLIVSGLCRAQQDPQYNQYMFNQLVINPAYAGSKDAISAVMDLRKQWVAMPGSPQTGSLSLHGPLLLNSLGLGGHLIMESIGPTDWTAAYFDAAYRFKLKRGKLSFGISAGMVNYNINTSKLDYKDAGEPLLNYTGPRTKFDINAGFYYYNQSFYVGGSVTHLNKPTLYDASVAPISTSPNAPNISLFFSLQSHYFLYAGKGFQLNENVLFNPSVMVKYVQGGTPSADLNLNFLLKNRIWVGVSARLGYGFVALVQVFVTDKFKVGYAFEQGINRIGIQGQSSHEVVLSYDLNIYKSKMLSPRYL